MACRRTLTRAMAPWTAALLLLAMTACASPEAVHLWNARTDQIVNCEPASDHAQHPKESAAKQAACIAYYKEHGFIRISPPQ